MLIVLAIFLITVFASSHEKYIDSLLEEENQGVLNRRILESFEKPENVDKFNRENILNEEFIQIRKRRAVDGNSNDKRNMDTMQESSFMTTRSVDTDNESSESESDSVDTTSNEKEMITTELKNKDTSNIDTTLQTEEPKEDSSPHFPPSPYEMKTESTKEDDLINESSSNSQQLNNTPVETKTQKSKIKFDFENKSEISKKNVQGTATITNEFVEKYSTTNPTTDNTLATFVTHKATTDIIDLTSYKTSTESSALIEYLTVSPYESNLTAKVNNRETSGNKKAKVSLNTGATTNKSPVVSQNMIDVNIITSRIQKQTEHTQSAPDNWSNVLNKIKTESDLEEVKPSAQKKYEEHKNMKPYEVYEIPWPKSTAEPPFVKIPEPAQDQAHFVPVYKYSPNFAYYNPTNRRGPNAVEENSIEIDTYLLREGNKPVVNEFVLDLNDELRKFGVIKDKPKEDAKVKPSTTSPIYIEDFENKEEITVTKLPDSDEDNTEKAPVPDNADELLMLDLVSETNSQDSYENDSSDNKVDTIAKVINMTDEKDVFIHLEKLKNMNIKIMRSNDVKVGVYMTGLKDLIEKDNAALKQYDWLETTVQIQSALRKLFLLIDRTRNSNLIDPADVQILKYTVFVHNFSLEQTEAYKLKNGLTKRVSLSSRNKKKRNTALERERLRNKVWMVLETLLPDFKKDKGLDNLYEFLLDVKDSLFGLHEAIMNIAKVTRFKNQHWFDNIKDLYLTPNGKHLRELLLHISVSRLLDLIETSCKKGLITDFIQYVKTHKTESKRTIEQMVFVLKIIDEINNKME